MTEEDHHEKGVPTNKQAVDSSATSRAADAGFQHLGIEAILRDYRVAKTRAIFLNVEGTLTLDACVGLGTSMERYVAALEPNVIDSLRKLVDDQSNIVTVISGREVPVIQEWFNQVNGIGMFAEHGLYFVLPERLRQGSNSDDVILVDADCGSGTADAEGGGWRSICRDAVDNNSAWKKEVHGLMQHCAKCVPGSVVEYTGSGLAWNFQRVVDTQLCREMADELERYIDPNAGPDMIKVVHGEGYVEVKHRDADEGAAVRHVLDEVRSQIGPLDFALYIGNGLSDKDMFGAVNNMKKRSISQFLGTASEASSSNSLRSWVMSPSCAKLEQNASKTTVKFERGDDQMRFYSVTVGHKPSNARHFLHDIHEVSNLLQQLASQSLARKLSQSASKPSSQTLVD